MGINLPRDARRFHSLPLLHALRVGPLPQPTVFGPLLCCDGLVRNIILMYTKYDMLHLYDKAVHSCYMPSVLTLS